ncbi:TonB-dependent receptor plug domain-containing protein [Synoicihabitans lomoniglobus]|uniref:TonB-dependent receptor n=1 Tax=Synoicihabitans lomoniglobus TaxID=2909285 RepID=A0AAE9ZSB0_9BACT|nr:TonB-dependent receptor [Opitutaceae bacterium LMO-M01]WED64320.1 TonB-dependent receptor [Opitutaceae bacterium LMO-M01]
MATPTYRKLLTVALLAAVVPTAGVRAQSTPADEATRSEESAAVVELQQVEVTGSRLRSLVGEQPAMPVITLGAEELSRRGMSRLADVRWAIPQLGASVGFNDNMMNGGPSRAQQSSTSFDLRGLGGNSTLVLIDGRRIPHTGQAFPGGAGGREDFNIDGLPVSAIERIDILPQGAGAIYGSDAIAGVVNIVLKKNYTGGQLDLSYDNTFDGDAANLTASLTGGFAKDKFSGFVTVSTAKQNALAARDRAFSFAPAPSAYTPYEGATLSTAYAPDFGGSNLPGLSTHVVALPDGTSGSGYTADALVGNTIQPHYNYANYSHLVDASDSKSILFKGDYEFTDTFRPYIEVRWSEIKFDYVGSPLSLTTQLPANYLGNPFSEPVYLSKVFYDIRPETDASQENSGLTLGVEGDWTNGWRYDLGLTWTRNVVYDKSVNSGFNWGALGSAWAITDPASQLNFAYDSRTSGPYTGALDSVLASQLHEDTSDVYDALLVADGPVWTGWAGDVRLAVGAESQKEEVEFFIDPVVSYALSEPFSRTTNAVFAEVAFPLISEAQGIPGLHRLEIRGAGRYEDFSDIGSQLTPSVSALLQPFPWMTIRAARTEGFKAPKLYDLLSPNYSTTTNITASRNVIDTARGGEAVVGSYDLTSGGQPGLNPETSVSRNIGIVLDVPWIKGLSLSADWWDTLFTDKVGSTSYQTLIDHFPARITRGAKASTDPSDWLGPITGFDTSALNLAWVKAQGYDLGLTYHRMTEWGEFLATGTYTEQDPQTSLSTPASSFYYYYKPERFSGSFFWAKNGWEAGFSVNHQGTYYISGLTNTQYAYPSFVEWNPRVAYSFADNGGDSFVDRALAGSKIGLTVINVFNAGPSDYAASNGRVVMDPRLSRYVLNFTKKF